MQPLGVTRHQFPLDPRIPYTSHNSGACVAVEAAGVPAGSVQSPAAWAFEFVGARAADGADPGVCVAEAPAVTPAVIAFGRRAASRLVEVREAEAAARAAGLALRALGGSGLGVIGALGSVALRAEGSQGRFIDLPGLRDLAGRVTVAAVSGLGIRTVARGTARRPGPGDAFETLGWVRPRLRAGRAVLPIEWSEVDDAWVPVDRKRQAPAGQPPIGRGG
jgi:hypothetical protein